MTVFTWVSLFISFYLFYEVLMCPKKGTDCLKDRQVEIFQCYWTNRYRTPDHYDEENDIFLFAEMSKKVKTKISESIVIFDCLYLYDFL